MVLAENQTGDTMKNNIRQR